MENTNEIPYAEFLSSDQLLELKRLLIAAPDEASSLAALGRTLGAAASGESPEESARYFLRRRLSDIRAVLCADERIHSYCANASVVDATSVATAVAGALIATQFGGINVLFVAAVLSRIGLRSICEKTWK